MKSYSVITQMKDTEHNFRSDTQICELLSIGRL